MTQSQDKIGLPTYIITHNEGLARLFYLLAFYQKSSYNTQKLYNSHHLQRNTRS